MAEAVTGFSAAAAAVLGAAEPREKCRLSLVAADAFRAGQLAAWGSALPPARPGRPARPELRPPRDMPKRRALTTPAGRIALLHALAHIELNAVDLAWDIALRFGRYPGLDSPDFLADWVSVGADEARHFLMLADRLAELGAAYGDLPAHDGLWEAAEVTAADPLARLAIVPMVLEARGLDVTPDMIERLTRAGDAASAAILQTIHDEEIGHVAAGRRWFGQLAAGRGVAPDLLWQETVRRCFRGRVKPPFNVPSRARAGLPWDWYAPLAADEA